jgi:hypothetical protein
MSRPRCDPIDTAAVAKALGEGVPARRLYAEYASVAARPYARSSWEQLVKGAKNKSTADETKDIFASIDNKYAVAYNEGQADGAQPPAEGPDARSRAAARRGPERPNAEGRSPRAGTPSAEGRSPEVH